MSHLSYRSIQVRHKGSTWPTFRKIMLTVYVMVDRTLYGVSVNHADYCLCNEQLTVPYVECQ